MKIKKSLAFIAALSMLSVTGVNAFAEEAAVTEIESSAVEMTTETATDMEEEVVTETEATEEVAVDGIVEDDVITEDAEVTEQMLHDKFVSECGSDFIFMEETFINLNGIPSAIIKVEDPYKTTVDTYLVTMDSVKMLNSVIKGGMGSSVSHKSFTCNGQDFVAEFVKTMSDADFTSYITIYKCEKDGSLIATNIKSKKIHSAIYGDIGNGTFDWIGDRNITVDQCISNDSNSITLKYENNRENTSKTVVYEYDESTNSFVEPGSNPVTPENPDEDDIKSANVTIGDKKFIIKTQSGEVIGDYYPVKMYLSIYFEDGTATNLQNIIVNEDVSFGGDGHYNAYNVNNYFSIANNIITIKSKVSGDTNYFFDKVTNKFVEATSIPEPPDEKTFTVEIPYTYFNVVGSNTSDTFNGDLRKSMQAISVKITDCNNGAVKSLNGGCSACYDNEYLESITLENVKPGKLVIKGTGADARSSDDGSHINAGYYVGQNWYTFEISVNIDENGNIVTGSTGGNNSGTSNNSTSNTTANSPATSDTMAIPAVAGSAALVLGAVICVSKKRK